MNSTNVFRGMAVVLAAAAGLLQAAPAMADVVASEGWARCLSLDLLAQLKGFEKNGQFRYTPPTHTILAFHQALLELEQEGGIPSRGARYARTQA